VTQILAHGLEFSHARECHLAIDDEIEEELLA
jgi:hypothetical protein